MPTQTRVQHWPVLQSREVSALSWEDVYRLSASHMQLTDSMPGTGQRSQRAAHHHTYQQEGKAVGIEDEMERCNQQDRNIHMDDRGDSGDIEEIGYRKIARHWCPQVGKPSMAMKTARDNVEALGKI
ncbi:uncharacterized protein PADG_12335 [Paracoccidioides brasiliensis Pb18]|uniref:Uncharacterized protein n=1 Tax=Paracoccidioides brasiliensis (strain Pb18) TaxID=502780 RepID=A0A0A0HVU4_PARBD|nr:uncharacterized protein PADG_12335 [Paracoccidioides brasiliensis Pb18]KGM91560.1 hypothetical protein PADG_12335 [Paracoccidioides brasiliensis Pb18]